MSNFTPPPPANAYQAPTPMSPSDEKLWATLIHIGGILFGVLPALIGYIVLKDRGPFIRAHTATALNFQITLLIAYVVGGLLTLVLVGFLVLLAAWVLSIVFGIMAALAANRGQYYRYPLTITFVN
jgi:uncharacterized Tic20 family protein